MDVLSLNKQFGIKGNVDFKEFNHTIVAQIKTPSSMAEISLYGAQVLSFRDNTNADLLFMSSESYYQDGKAMRGGIPICWPWFNSHPSNSALPSHGFARISTWNVISTQVIDNFVEIVFELSSDKKTFALWPYHFTAQVKVVVGDELSVSLSTKNTDDKPFDISSALHTYFNVSDIKNIQLEGLKAVSFLDDVINKEGVQQEGLLNFDGRIDRRYRNTTSACLIHDENRKIKVEKQGSSITVVWNPGEPLAKEMADLGNEDYKRMLCVEAANSLEDAITVMPGKVHTLETIISSK